MNQTEWKNGIKRKSERIREKKKEKKMENENVHRQHAQMCLVESLQHPRKTVTKHRGHGK